MIAFRSPASYNLKTHMSWPQVAEIDLPPNSRSPEVCLRTMCLVAVAMIAASLTGCGGGDPVKQQITAMNDMTSALESGNMDKIKAAAQKLKDASAKLEAVKDPAEQKKLMEKHGADMIGAAMKMGMASVAAEAKMTEEQKKQLKEIMASAKF